MLAGQLLRRATACKKRFRFPVTSLYHMGFKERDWQEWDLLQLADAVDIHTNMPDKLVVYGIMLRLKSKDLKGNIPKLLIV